MAPNRNERQGPLAQQTPMIMEVLRQANQAEQPAEGEKEDDRIPLFWRIFGGTVLSITSLVVMTAYQSLSANFNELRQDLEQTNLTLHKEIVAFGQTQDELVKKEEVESRLRSVCTSLKELQEERKDIQQLKAHCRSLQEKIGSGIGQNKETAQQLHKLRERQAVEQQKAILVSELSTLRERLAGLETRRTAPEVPVMPRID